MHTVHGTRHMFFVEDVEVEEGVLFVRSKQPFGGSVSKLRFFGLFPGSLDQSCWNKLWCARDIARVLKSMRGKIIAKPEPFLANLSKLSAYNPIVDSIGL